MVQREAFSFSINNNGEPEVTNKTGNTIWFAFPINRKGLWSVKADETVAFKGRTKKETQKVINCLINEEYTMFDKFMVGDEIIQ